MGPIHTNNTNINQQHTHVCGWQRGEGGEASKRRTQGRENARIGSPVCNLRRKSQHATELISSLITQSIPPSCKLQARGLNGFKPSSIRKTRKLSESRSVAFGVEPRWGPEWSQERQKRQVLQGARPRACQSGNGKGESGLGHSGSGLSGSLGQCRSGSRPCVDRAGAQVARVLHTERA
jgi:hypothetical protein